MSGVPTISVVIPCYNAAPYVGVAIDSVVDQNWPKLDIIVVDDGSVDESADIAAAHRAGVRVIRKKNEGPGSARNAGISAAKGEYIAFLDADDLWLPQKLERQIELIQRIPSVRMAYGSWHVWLRDSLRPDPEWLRHMDDQHEAEGGGAGPSGWVYCDLLLDSILNCSTVLAHRSMFDEVGMFDMSLPVGEDYDLWLRMSRVTQIVRVREAVAIYRRHANATTRAVREVNYQGLVLERALSRWGYAGPDGSSANRVDVRVGLARTWRDFAVGHLRERNWRTARHASTKALMLNPRDLRAAKVLLRAALHL